MSATETNAAATGMGESAETLARYVPEYFRQAHDYPDNADHLIAELQDKIRAIAAQPAPVVGGDWVMVPREPAGDMIDAMLAPWYDDRYFGHRATMVASYKAVIWLSARPAVEGDSNA